ncbi:Phage-related baseplate assembly protein [Posidoniimonas corsicana]|uniref:Phage-related baseplate assembly protein n=1 Tax=Posidoniimonas corsicana TaxID=1938618 RepID=A0A5C5VD50_9BACT|nr:type VI secretion system tip protein TssI/VgrG [Posidoniimonas corsicana]TWT36526.1 Phage-related baseplate assembly protein [Posidoniimonas corsicana]
MSSDNPGQSDASSDDQELSQDNRALRISTALNHGVLLVTRFAGHEGVSIPFRFEIELLSEQDDVEFNKLLGASATVTAEIPNMPARKWNGVITRFSQLSRDDNFTHYSATLEPATYALALRTNCRVFQEEKIDDILDTLLDGLDVMKHYTKADQRQPRNYCVQYRESDFAFFSRLVEEYGLLYYFEHQDDAHTLVLCDDSTQLSEIPNLDPVDFCEINEGDGTVKTWEKTQRLTPTSVSLRDSHFQQAGDPFKAEKDLADEVTVGTVNHKLNPAGASHEHFDCPGRYAVRYDSLGKASLEIEQDQVAESPLKHIATDASAVAQQKCELLANQAISIAGESDVLPFSPGGVFTLNGHYNADGAYLLTHVSHVVTLGVGVTSAAADDSLQYSNAFQCLPSSLPYRTPLATARPLAYGLQSARVVADLDANRGADDFKEQLIDQYGRVKVQFLWDRREDASAGEGNNEAPSDGDDQQQETAQPADRSCWIRVAQFWAGKRWGAFFLPRHGHEVLVAFEHGDPDRPVIVGSLYNSENMPPMELPTNTAVSGIKSCSLRGNPEKDSNSIVFFDELGNEHLDLHSEKHTISVTEESHHEFVAGPSVRVFGGLSRLFSSGAGGGPAPQANPNKLKAAVTKKYRNIGLAKNFEADINVTLGNAANIVGGVPCGSSNESVFGGKLGLCIDPMGWLDDGLAKQVQDLLMPTGEWSGLFGQGRYLHYGSETTIRHGSEINRRSKQAFDSSNPRTSMVAGIVTASAALTALGFASQTKNPIIWENLVRSLGPRGVSGALLNLLIEFEKAYGETDAGAEKQSEASSLSAQADALKSDYASLILQLASSVTDQGAALTAAGQQGSAAQQAKADSEDNSVDDAEQEADDENEEDAATTSDDSDQPDDSSDQDADGPSDDEITFGSDDADVYQCYDGLLATGARHISLRARATDDDDTDPSLIHLDAQGSDGDDNGVVAINSTGQATVVCGPASVQIRRDGQTGQIDISAGNDGAITLSVGPEGSGSQITMTSDGIKLSVGPDGGPCLELTSSGVTMSCGSNSVAVDESGQTTQGMNVSQQAEMSFEAKGTMVSIEGSGQTAVKGAVTMIN